MSTLSCQPQVELSIVVPCYNEEEGLTEFHRRASLAAAAEYGDSHEIVMVDDGSRDGTWARIAALTEKDPHVVGVRLARNHGHQLALTAGLSIAKGAEVLILDADLQDPPELLGAMRRKLNEERADVVYGERRSRSGETPFKKATASLFYRLLARFTFVEIPVDTGDFRLMTQRIARLILEMPEQDRFIRGMVAWLGFKQVPFEYERNARHLGSTKYPLRKMFLLGIDAFLGFSMVPLRIAAYMSTILFVVLMGGLVYTLAAYLSANTVRGWTSLTFLILLISAVQLATLAVLGEYVGRIYIASKQRPLFLIDEIKVASRSLESPPSDLSRLEKANRGLDDPAPD